MLKLSSLFWSTADTKTLTHKFEKLGFDISPSPRHPENQSVFFGPDAIEFVNASIEGISALEFESDDIVNDYKNLQKSKMKLEKPKVAMNANTPLWFGFDLPESETEFFKASVVMDSPETQLQMGDAVLPRKHPNTCFGIESITMSRANTEEFAQKWAQIIKKPASGLSWNELLRTTGHRVLAGQKFIDCISAQTEGVFMVTLKVVDLELTKEICEKAGAKVTPCATRDGFIVPGHPHIRFVRAAWSRFLPQTQQYFPYYRREDHFRPLGGTYTSTLEDGFEDNWKY